MLEQYESPNIKKVSMPMTEEQQIQWPLGWFAKGGKDRA